MRCIPSDYVSYALLQLLQKLFKRLVLAKMYTPQEPVLRHISVHLGDDIVKVIYYPTFMQMIDSWNVSMKC